MFGTLSTTARRPERQQLGVPTKDCLGALYKRGVRCFLPQSIFACGMSLLDSLSLC